MLVTFVFLVIAVSNLVALFLVILVALFLVGCMALQLKMLSSMSIATTKNVWNLSYLFMIHRFALFLIDDLVIGVTFLVISRVALQAKHDFFNFLIVYRWRTIR